MSQKFLVFKEMKSNKGAKITASKKTRPKTNPVKKPKKTKSDDNTSNPTENGTPATEFVSSTTLLTYLKVLVQDISNNVQPQKVITFSFIKGKYMKYQVIK